MLTFSGSWTRKFPLANLRAVLISFKPGMGGQDLCMSYFLLLYYYIERHSSSILGHAPTKLNCPTIFGIPFVKKLLISCPLVRKA
jgi:hypothetical protein